VRKQVVNIPSFVVRLDSQKHIEFSLQSPFGGGRAGKYSNLLVYITILFFFLLYEYEFILMRDNYLQNANLLI
jgi:hypothetical protein